MSAEDYTDLLLLLGMILLLWLVIDALQAHEHCPGGGVRYETFWLERGCPE